MAHLEMVPVASSNIASIGHDDGTRELYVQFKSGGLYVYEGVGREQFDDMKVASSPTDYLNRWVKSSHPFRRM